MLRPPGVKRAFPASKRDRPTVNGDRKYVYLGLSYVLSRPMNLYLDDSEEGEIEWVANQ
jgi:hypothetical protein